jgi:hypothetical protein
VAVPAIPLVTARAAEVVRVDMVPKVTAVERPMAAILSKVVGRDNIVDDQVFIILAGYQGGYQQPGGYPQQGGYQQGYQGATGTYGGGGGGY